MAVEFKLPDLGENIESGDIVNVMVSEGDDVQAEQNVFEVETGKAVVELPTPHAGKVTKLHVKKGTKVKVGDVLLTIEPTGASTKTSTKPAAPAQPEAARDPSPAAEPTLENGESAKPAKKEKAKPKTQAEPAAQKPAEPAVAKSKPAPAPAARSMPSPTKVPPAGPATRRLARELGVDLASVDGSGAGGRITEEDVKAAVRQGGASQQQTSSAPILRTPRPDGVEDRDKWGTIRRAPMSQIRKAIAVNMERSASTIPHVTNFDDADITELERIRKGGMADYVDSSVKLTMMAFVMKAIAQSLRLHPMVNASVDMESEEIVYKDYVNIGVAVDTDRGLVVPVIRDVDRMTIPRIAQALSTVAEKARGAQFKLDDLQGSTFTISNLGTIGGTYSTPIINPPNVAILLTGRSRKLPIVIEDKLEIRLMMPLSLSYDHRIVDGATAARFLNEVITYLKVPGRLLLAP
jgi:pyruvate dehydrogenase E2 component (dihydrolipoyllysine-residue acetyltransferase)